MPPDALGANLAPAAGAGRRRPGSRAPCSGFAQEIGALSAFRLESCIHCGICADACHFYIATEDPQYTPIWKVEPFKQAYKREASPFAPLFRLFGLKREVTADQLEQWQHLLFDSCNMCGRCSLICPMGIDVAALIEQARHAMFDAGPRAEGALPEGGASARHRPARSERRTLSRSIARDRQTLRRRHPARQARGRCHAVRAADRHRALPRRGGGAGAGDAASGRFLHVSQRRPGRGELRLLRRRQGVAARHQPAPDRAGHRLQGQDPAGARMRSRLHRLALGGGGSVRQAPALQGAPRHRIPRGRAQGGAADTGRTPGPARPPSTIPASWCARAASTRRRGR